MLYKKELTDVATLAREVADLADATIREAEEGAANSSWRREAFPHYGGTKTTGALRRRSMDLTRALAQMRKP